MALSLVGACSAPQGDDRPSQTGESGTPGSVAARAEAQNTCGRFVVTALSVDTTIDAGPEEARRRAAQQHGTPELADQLDGHGRDHLWPTLVEHQARVEVQTSPVADDPPPERPDSAAAGVIADRVALSRNGWRQPLPQLVAYCTLAADRTSPPASDGATGWKVAAITFADSTGNPTAIPTTPAQSSPPSRPAGSTEPR